jgi:apolipoprotein N-acyltransferase
VRAPSPPAGPLGGRRLAALRLAAAVATGALLAAAFPGPDIGPLALIALVPLLLAVETARPRQAGAFGYLAGLTFFGLHLLWIADFLSWTGAVAWLAWGALSGFEALFVAAFFALVPATRRLGGWRLLVLPACWAAIELLRAHQPLGGFPWGLLALSQHGGGPLLPLARVVGGYGLAAVLVAVNLAVACWLRALPAAATQRPWRWRRLAAVAGWPALAVALVAAGLLAPAAPPAAGPTLDLAVVQAGLRGGHGQDLGQSTEAVFANHVRVTEALARSGGPRPDLVVWGEGAADADPLRNPDRLARVAQAAETIQAPILLGATTVVDPTHRATEALLFTPGGQLADRYRKRRLVPFGEFVPWGGLLGRLIPATRQGVPYDKQPGGTLEPLLVDGVRVGTVICWESAYLEDARQLARDGAGLLLVMTNNASFGDGPGSRQHLATSQLRAVEEGRTVVHAAVTGISAVVGADGVARQQTGLYQQTTVPVSVQVRTGLTPYARWGRLVEAGFVGVAVGGLVAVLLLGFRRRRLLGGVGRPGPSTDRLSFPERGRGSRPASGGGPRPTGAERRPTGGEPRPTGAEARPSGGGA